MAPFPQLHRSILAARQIHGHRRMGAHSLNVVHLVLEHLRKEGLLIRKMVAAEIRAQVVVGIRIGQDRPTGRDCGPGKTKV